MEAATTPPVTQVPTPEVPEAKPEVETPVVTSEPEPAEPVAEENPATGQTPDKLFKFSAVVHVGEGADECDRGETGACEDPDHFHAWIRLPNQFQHDTIRRKAIAAKSRIARQLRDPETDGYEVLEAELALARSGDLESLVDDLVGREFLKNHMEATDDVRSEEEYETVAEDIQRYQVLEAMEADDRPQDEYDELTRHISEYHQKIDARRTELEKPLHDSLLTKGADELIDMLREDRIEAESTEEFMRAYSKWTWVTCTMKPRVNGRPNEPVYKDIAPLLSEAQEVLEALDGSYADLEEELQRRAGNS